RSPATRRGRRPRSPRPGSPRPGRRSRRGRRRSPSGSRARAPAARSRALRSSRWWPVPRRLLLGARCLPQALGTRDNFHDLLRYLRLPLPVRLEGEVVDELGGVLGCVAHRGHARAVLGSSRLEQRAVDRNLDVVRGEALEDLLRVRLVDPERAAVVGALVLAAPVLVTVPLVAEH